jgi:hypothetical protein
MYLLLPVLLNTIPEDNRQIDDRDGISVVLPRVFLREPKLRGVET